MLECKVYKKGDILFKKGDPFTTTYINISGTLARFDGEPPDESEELIDHGEYPEFSVIGQEAFDQIEDLWDLQYHTMNETVYVENEKEVVCLVLNINKFEK